MKELKEEFKYGRKGITLITLIITIIVLLILAGVTIATLTGDNGILTRANDATEKNKQANAEEQVKLAVLASYGEDGKININMLNNNLKNIIGISGLPISTLPNRISIENSKYKIGRASCRERV